MPKQILSIFLIVNCFFLSLKANTIIVESGKMTIHEAISQSSDFDTVLVKNGYFKENQLVVTKPLIIIGENFPVVDANFENEIFTIKSNKVIIQGFHFINIGKTATIDWAAVKVLEAEDVQVIGNHIERGYFGIYLSACRKCTVYGNLIMGNPSEEQNTGNGVHAWKCDSISIQNNQVEGHRDGVYFEFVTNSWINTNLCTKNIRYGLHFMFSHNNAYEFNTFKNNGAGVAVMYTKKMTMKNNHFDENLGAAAYGLLLKDISDSYIEGNTFNKNTAGVFMEGTSRCVFKNNQFSNNGWAIRVQASCDDNTFTFNDFTRNTFDIATNGSIVLNSLDHNYWDKYEGYDLDKNGIGDVPYRPLSIYSTLVEQMPFAMMLWRSFSVFLLDQSERVLPSITPENLKDESPRMKK